MNVDEQLFLTLNQTFSGSASTLFFRGITYLGNGLVLALFTLPAFFFLSRATFKRHALTMVVAVALSGLAVNLLKIAVDRPRPPEHFEGRGVTVHAPAGVPPDRSFPSGHSQTAFGVATYLSCIHPPASPLFLGLALLVGLSRIVLGVHFPLDVVVGGLFGAVFSIVAYRWREKRATKIP